MKKIGLLVFLGVALLLVLSACQGATGSAGAQGTPGAQGAPGAAGAPGATGPTGPGLEPKTQTFDVYMSEKKAVAEGPLVELIPHDELISEFYYWEPSVLVVLKGDTVVLNVSNPRGTIHSLGVPAFGVDTGPLAIRGGKATIEFVADRAGTFVFLCTIPYDPTTDPEECHPDHKYQTGVLMVLDR